VEWVARFVFYGIIVGALFLGYIYKLLTEALAILAILIGVLIPIRIDERDRAIQRLENCTASILSFREKLLDYHRLATDDYGNVIDGTAADGDIPQVRASMQNAKDSTYTLCSGIITGSKGALLDDSQSPWADAPISINSKWSQTNVSGLYSWSTIALKMGSQIKPTPINIPFTNIPAWPW